MASPAQISKLKDDGFVVIENFLSEDEINSLKEECRQIVDDMNPEEHNFVFKTTDEMKTISSDYFMSSGDKIRFFFEDGAKDKDGKLKVDKHLAVNKIGHALHVYKPAFRKVTFGTKMKDLAKSLDLINPVVPQSMYIFKQPHMGGEVIPHQDCAYLFTTPFKVFGFWIALEDATLENGCLHFIPGSHKNGLHGNRQMIVNPEYTPGSGVQSCIYTSPPNSYEETDYIPLEVKKGTMVVIDGLVVHKSEKNVSSKSRHIYTFHLFDKHECEWSSKNWLQETEALPFPPLYDTSPEMK